MVRRPEAGDLADPLFAQERRERIPRRSLVDSVRAVKDEAKAVKTEWAEEGALKRRLKEQAKAVKLEAKQLGRRATGR